MLQLRLEYMPRMQLKRRRSQKVQLFSRHISVARTKPLHPKNKPKITRRQIQNKYIVIHKQKIQLNRKNTILGRINNQKN